MLYCFLLMGNKIINRQKHFALNLFKNPINKGIAKV